MVVGAHYQYSFQMLKRTPFLLAFVVTVLAQLFAQTPDTAVVRGRVVDSSQAAIPGVQITITNRRTDFKRTTQTDSSGAFSVSGLAIGGNYDVTAQKSGFADAHLENITVVGGGTANINLQMNPAAEKEEITVTGVVGEVRTDEPQLGDRLGELQVQETPLLNRRITYLPLLDAANRPAINQGDVFMNQNLFTTNGTGRRQAWFEVDGANAVDLWGRQTIFTNLTVESVEEMNVLTSPFSAEYGASAGSAINIVTQSGSNQYHGSVVANFRPAPTAAPLSGFTAMTATSGNQLTSDELYQPALAFGGPIGSSDRTHFFLAGQYSLENRASPISSPVAPGSFVGEYRDWMGLARIDHQINDRNNLFWRGNIDGFVDTNPNGTVGGNNLPTVDRKFYRHTYTTELGETMVISPTLVNDVRLQFQLASPITQFAPVVFGTQFVVPISAGGTFTTGTSQSALLLNRQYEFNDTLGMTHGRHNFRFGAQAIHAHNGGDSKEFGGPIFLGQFKYNTCTLALTTCESPAFLNDITNVQSYTQSFGNGNYTVDDTLWALFAQDDWHLLSNLTVNLGLRYERQTFTDSTKDFAPRVGLVWDPYKNGRDVIRAGFGIYYSQIVDNSEANYALIGPTGVFNYTATPGQIGFPAAVSDAPLPAFPAGAKMPLRSLYIRPGRASFYDQFFDTSTLIGYQSGLLNPYTEQWTLGLEHQLAPNWVISMDYVGSHSVKVNRPLDVDAPSPFIRTMPDEVRSPGAANCTRPLWVAFYANLGVGCDPSNPALPTPPYALIQSDVNDGVGTYNALDINVSHRFNDRFQMLASYTWSHAIDNVDPDIPGQNPNDPNFTGAQEIGDAIYDQRHRFVLSGVYVAPLKISLGGVLTAGSGLPFNITTGANNTGDTGGATDRPVINGVVVSRNAGRGFPVYDFSPFIERPFALGSERVQLKLRVEAFNVTNHPNFIGYSGTWGNDATPGLGFGSPLSGITAQLPARSLQFMAKLSF